MTNFGLIFYQTVLLLYFWALKTRKPVSIFRRIFWERRRSAVKNTSLSDSGRGKSSSKSYNLDSRDLLTQDEVAKLDPSYCIIVVAGVPFKVPKYRASDHPAWGRTGDQDPSMRIEAKELVLCKEKSSCKEIDRKNDIKSVVMHGEWSEHERGKGSFYTPTGKHCL